MFSLLILIPFLAAINIVLAENIVEVELINPSPHTIVDPYEDIYVETYIHTCNESLCGDKFRMIYQFYDTENDFGIPVPDYTDLNVSTKVVKIIQSYTGVVNKMVWRKF